MPDRPDLHKVCGAAAQNEESEHPENPMEGNVTPFTHQVNQRDRDTVVRKCDQAVRNYVQPNNPRVP